MEGPKSLALCLVCNKDLGPLNQIPTFYHRPNVLFSRTPATSTLLRHKLEAIVKDIVVFRSETCCLCVKCAGLINLADALEAELKSVCRQLSDHYWRTARLRGFGEERAVVCITRVPPLPCSAAPGVTRQPAQPEAVPPRPPVLGPGPVARPPVPPAPPGAVWAPGLGPVPVGWHPGMVPVTVPGAEPGRSVSQESDDANGVCQLLSAVEVELTEVKQEPGDGADTNNHLMREPVDIEVDPWKDLGYEDASAMERLVSQTRSLPPPCQSPQVQWPLQPVPPGPDSGPVGAPSAGPRPTRTYCSAGPPLNLPPGAQRTHQRIMKTLTSHSSAIQQAVANGVLSLEVRQPDSAAPPLPGGRQKSRPAPPRALAAIAPAPATPAPPAGESPTAAAPLTPAASFKIKLPCSMPRGGAASPAAAPPRPVTPKNIDAPPMQEADCQPDASGEDSISPSRTVAWFHKSQRLRPGNYTYVKSGDSLNGKLIPCATPKGRPRRRPAGAEPIVRLVLGTPMNRRRYPPLEKALAIVTAAAHGLDAGRVVAQEPSGAGPAPAEQSRPGGGHTETSGGDAGHMETSSPGTPAKRGPGRPRKDGLPPGSGRSAARRRRRRKPAGQAGKRPASDSQPGTAVAKRQRPERPPESLEGRRHSRRLSARLSQPESESAAEAEAAAAGSKQEPAKAAAEEKPSPPPAEGDAVEAATDGAASGDGMSSVDDKVIPDDAKPLSSAGEALFSELAVSSLNGEAAFPGENGGSAAAAAGSEDSPDAADGQAGTGAGNIPSPPTLP